MATPSLTYDFYRNTYKGSLGEGELDAPLVKAQALLVSMTGETIPEKFSEKWLLALCALCDRVAGKDTRGMVKSESVGSVSYTYTDAQASVSDLSCVYPFLAGTGLLWRGIQ